MRTIQAISIVYMRAEFISLALTRFLLTSGLNPVSPNFSWTWVDNHYPVTKDQNYVDTIGALRDMVDASLVDPGKNLGGHGGFSFGLKEIHFEDDDFILNYDLDSYPLDTGWLTAMIEVMEADPSLAYVALLDTRCVNNRDWKFETLGGHKVAFTDSTDMWNVTLFRGKALREGMKAQYTYYGQVEAPMQKHVESLGMRFGYLYDFREKAHPHTIDHDDLYTEYKKKHIAYEFNGSFEEFLKERQK